MKTRSAQLVLVGLLAGCGGDPILGSTWTASAPEGRSNSLEVDDGLRGKATVFAYVSIDEGPALIAFHFDVAARILRTGDYRFELKADQLCTPSGSYCISDDVDVFDFEMDCTLNRDRESLDCQGDGGWDSYEFDWQRSLE
jgi:hypothetical protein